ncbi:MAG: hypothetical protein V6Z89_18490 [Desulfobacter sp.]
MLKLSKKGIFTISCTACFLAVTIFYFINKGGIVISEPTWKCALAGSQWKCDIGFEIKNERHSEQRGEISIMLLDYKTSFRIPSISISDNRFISFEIKANTSKKFQIKIYTDKKPETIFVSILDSQKIVGVP